MTNERSTATDTLPDVDAPFSAPRADRRHPDRRDPGCDTGDRDPRSAPAGRGSLAAWCADRRWRTLLAALAVLAGAIVLLGAGIRTSSDTDQLVGDSKQAALLTQAADFGGHPTENVVVSTRTGAFPSAAVRRLETELTSAYTGLTGVAEVGSPVVSPDRGTLLLPVGLAAANGDDDAIDAAVRPMLTVTARLARAHPELMISQVGPGSGDVQVGDQIDHDFHRAELISLPVTLGILLIAFGSVIAAGVPVLLGVGAVAAAMGLTALISRHLLPVDPNAQSLVLLIGLAVGVDYALFVTRRSREERAAGYSTRDAVKRACATAGRAVVISGITVVISMAGMLVAGGMFTSMAVGAMLVVAVAVIASVTVLPALLSVLGDRVEKLWLPLRRRGPRAVDTDGWWGRLAGRVARRPLIWSLVAVTALVALAAPALSMRTALPGVESFPRSLPVVSAASRLEQAFPQQGSTVDVVVRAPSQSRAVVRSALTEAFPVARATGRIVGTEADLATSADGTVTVLHLASPYDQSDRHSDQAVDAVRNQVVPQVRTSLAGVTGARVNVGGVAEGTDLARWMNDRLPWVVGFVLVLTFLVMLLSFGSPWLASITVGLNLLSVAAGFGLITLVFQHTWAQGLLGFTSIGAIAAWLPLLMFVMLFGLSMDYHVFVVSRVREAWKTGVGPREAVRIGVAGSAGTVTSAAVVMVAVFAIFATLSQLELKQLGVGLASAVLLDATLVRGVLLPAVLAMLGDRAHTGPKWVPALHG